MGVLSEAIVCRLDDSACYKANTWSSADGSLEAFWTEGGHRVTHFFTAAGDQIGAWKRYRLKNID